MSRHNLHTASKSSWLIYEETCLLRCLPAAGVGGVVWVQVGGVGVGVGGVVWVQVGGVVGVMWV